jgi:hypothetical protein
VSSIPIHFDLILERNGSDIVPWDVVHDECDYPEDFGNEWCDYIMGIETNTYAFANPKEYDCGERVAIRGHARVEFSKDWTECGYEHNSEFEWDDGAVTVEKLPPAAERGEKGGG